MLKNYLFFVFFIFLCNIYSQNTYVPDDNFEQALIDLGYDDVLDDYVLTSNISGVTDLYLYNNIISDLTGIEGFTSLEEFTCVSNYITSLDLSQNTALTVLDCYQNSLLTSLDLSQNTALQRLRCFSNQFASLDVSQNTALINLECMNNQLTSLDVSQNINLESLRFFNNPLTNIDLTKNTVLSVLSFYNNQFVSIDLTQNTALTNLDCKDNQLTSLDLSQNTALTNLDCQNNQLTSLDLSQNIALTNLYCQNNQLTSVNFRNGHNASIYWVDFTINPSLFCIQIDNQANANAGIGSYANWKKDTTAAYSEDCSQITYIPDDNFEQALIDLGIDKDGIVNDNVATIDLYGVTSLNIESKNINDLTGIEDFTSLEILNCQSNQLSNLDFSVNTSLTELNCSLNQLTGLNAKNGNNALLTTFNATNNPNLQCIKIDNEIDANNGLAPYNAWQKDATATYSEGCLDTGFTYVPDENFEQALIDLGIDTDGIINNSVATADVSDITSLDVSAKNIKNLKGIEDFISLTYLQCNNNYGIKLDLRQNIALTNLLCYYSSLTSLDLSQNIALTELRCNNNALTNLDISNNTALTLIKCDNNLLTSLDVSQNTALDGLWCYANQITSLDLSQNTAFTQLNCYFNKLTSLNIKNGNNTSITLFIANSNPDLLCIQVDNETDANNGVAPYNNWPVDAIVSYSEDCSYSGTTYVPDGNFEQALIDLSIDTDGIINQSVAIADIYQITSLNIESKSISDLTGIEDFTSLEILNCQSNQLINLDFSANTALMELNCSSNLLTSLNVKNGHNTLITTFNAASNPSLQCIKVDNETDANNDVAPYNTWQKDITATYSEGCLDSGFTYIADNNFEQVLIDLNIDSDGIINNSVATADVVGVNSLNVSSKNITNLKGIEDFTSLETLYCNSNALTSLDISQNTALTYLDCYTNQLSSLDIGQNIALERLDCRSNQLTSLDVSENIALIRLSCSQNQLTSLNVSQNTYLLGLFCYSNQLTSLDVSKNILLQGLYCDMNQIVNINLNGAIALDLLIAKDNNLTSLDVSLNIALTRIDCQYNQITGLDVSENNNLTVLNCNSNQLTSLDISNGNNSIISHFNAVENPSLTCIQVDNETNANNGVAPYNNWSVDAIVSYSEDCSYSGTTYVPDGNFEQALIDLGYITDGGIDGSVTTSEISTITTLDVSSKNISDLTGIEDFTSLETLIVSNNQLTRLDLSQNTNLIFLDASNNPLTTLILASDDIAKSSDSKTSQQAIFAPNNNILNIDIHDTDLVEIDLSNAPNLESFYAQGSKLTSLDVSNNGNLTVLNITNNPLTCVQVSQTQLNSLPSDWEKDAATVYNTDCQSYLGVDDEILSEGLILYPNPVSNILTVDSKVQIEKVEIFNILGQKDVEINSGFDSILLNNLTRGFYIIKVYSEKGTTVRKLIKQ